MVYSHIFNTHLNTNNTVDKIAIDENGVIFCVCDGVRTDGLNHKDGWEHVVEVYANHVGRPYSDILAMIEPCF